ncbi:ribbon-helix-helix domain-containing protein [Azospirillum thiophilum]|nr:ribbon-helix-helix domain-containing protein [Azospirillum thiophilum]
MTGKLFAFEGVGGCEELHSAGDGVGVDSPSTFSFRSVPESGPMQLQKKSFEDMAYGPDLRSLMVWPSVASRTIPLTDRRAKLRLEMAIWSGLDEISKKEERPVRDLCQEVDSSRPSTIPLTSAIRSYVLDYFRQTGAR